MGAMHRAGVPFMTGTDLSGAYIFAGFSLHHELEIYVQAGFSPMEALQAAARNPAIFLDELNSQVTVEIGKIANLVLLDASQLDNISNIKRIDAVILNGKVLFENRLADDAGKRRKGCERKNELKPRARSAACRVIEL